MQTMYPISILTSSFMLCLSLVCGQKMDKGAIGFPESEENLKVANKQNRQPIFLPSMCPTNELYYPGDQEADWICDCRPGYLYHPASDACWLAFKRGPCPEGQHLILKNSSLIPVCDINPCGGDNLVLWRGKCEILGAFTPCGNSYPASALWVNATNITIDCVQIEIEMRFAEDKVKEAPIHCPLGCKRLITGQCRPDIRK